MLLNEDIIKIGLNPHRISHHAERLQKSLKSGKKPIIYIEKTCHITSGSILTLPARRRRALLECMYPGSERDHLHWQIHSVVTLFPAAGAASRYFGPLTRFLQEVEAVAPSLIEGLAIVFDQKTTSLPVSISPQEIESLLHITLPEPLAPKRVWTKGWAHAEGVLSKQLGQTPAIMRFIKCLLCAFSLSKDGTLPKALAVATREGDTFLCTKIFEQLWTFPCLNNVVICPMGNRDLFLKHLSSLSSSLTPKVSPPPWLLEQGARCALKPWVQSWSVLEQGASLSTLRFKPSGEPYLDPQGNYSPVPAGHGELVHLFEDITEAHPGATCLHIRNLDNVIGASEAAKRHLSIPSQLFWTLRQSLEILRRYTFEKTLGKSPNNGPPIAPSHIWRALMFIISLVPKGQGLQGSDHKRMDSDPTALDIWLAVQPLFHGAKMRPGTDPWPHIHTYLQKPLSVFGVVKKRSGDLGGGPVFATLEDGQFVKMCLEMPHAQEKEKEIFFGKGGLVTHFNPVLVFFELRRNDFLKNESGKTGTPVDFTSLYDDRLWFMAEKEHRGQKVIYHETVLYELLGNSAQTNTVFLEVPRSLFRPNKTLIDTKGKGRASYGFKKVFAPTLP